MARNINIVAIIALVLDRAEKIFDDRPAGQVLIDWSRYVEKGRRPGSANLKVQKKLKGAPALAFGSKDSKWEAECRSVGVVWARCEITASDFGRGRIHVGIEIPDTSPENFAQLLREKGEALEAARLAAERAKREADEAERKVNAEAARKDGEAAQAALDARNRELAVKNELSRAAELSDRLAKNEVEAETLRRAGYTASVSTDGWTVIVTTEHGNYGFKFGADYGGKGWQCEEL